MRYLLLFCALFISSISALNDVEHVFIPRALKDDFYVSIHKRSGRPPGSRSNSGGSGAGGSNPGTPRGNQGGNGGGSNGSGQASRQNSGGASPGRSSGSQSRSTAGSSPVGFVVPQNESPPPRHTSNMVAQWERHVASMPGRAPPVPRTFPIPSPNRSPARPVTAAGAQVPAQQGSTGRTGNVANPTPGSPAPITPSSGSSNVQQQQQSQLPVSRNAASPAGNSPPRDRPQPPQAAAGAGAINGARRQDSNQIPQERPALEIATNGAGSAAVTRAATSNNPPVQPNSATSGQGNPPANGGAALPHPPPVRVSGNVQASSSRGQASNSRDNTRDNRSYRRTSTSLTDYPQAASQVPTPRVENNANTATPSRPAAKYKDPASAKLTRTKSSGDVNRKVFAKGNLDKKFNEKVDSVPFLPRPVREKMNKIDQTHSHPLGFPHSPPVPEWRATARRSGPQFSIPAGPDPPRPPTAVTGPSGEASQRLSEDSLRSSQRRLWGWKRPGAPASTADTSKVDPKTDGAESIASSRTKSFMDTFRRTSRSEGRASLGSQPSQPSQANGGIPESPFARHAQIPMGRNSDVSSQRTSEDTRYSLESGMTRTTAVTVPPGGGDPGHVLPWHRAELTTSPSASTVAPLRNMRVPSSIPRGPNQPKMQTLVAEEVARNAANNPAGPSVPGATPGALKPDGSTGSGNQKKGMLQNGLIALGAQAFYGESSPGAVTNFVGNAVAGATTVTGVALGAATFPAHAVIGPVVVGVGVATSLGMAVHAHVNNVKNHANKEKITLDKMLVKGQEQGFYRALSRNSALPRNPSKQLGVGGMKQSASANDIASLPGGGS